MADAAADALVNAPEPVSVRETESEFIELFPGGALSATDAEAITLRSPAHLVVFAGAEGSGKTTVLASIYEQFNRGPFAGFKFAGSRSLLGFEEICHLNRLASGRTQPETQRTRLSDGKKYYHLALRTASSGRFDILMSAISGELFRMARDLQEDAERLTFLLRADTLVVLVDGERLATPMHRTSAHADAAGILESLLDAKVVSPNCRVEVVFSKFDRITAAGQVALDFLARTQDKFEGKFRARVPRLSFRKIAARPAASPAPEDLDGLASAFASWTAALPPASAGEQPPQPAPAREGREFNKFGWRYLKRTREES